MSRSERQQRQIKSEKRRLGRAELCTARVAVLQRFAGYVDVCRWVGKSRTHRQAIQITLCGVLKNDVDKNEGVGAAENGVRAAAR